MSPLLSACGSLAPAAGDTGSAPASRLRLMALSGPMTDAARAARGVAALGTLGFAIENQACVTRRSGRFAGTDAQRAADLNDLAVADAALPDLVMATRGGFGAVRLLERLDYAALCPRLREAGTAVVGYSDNTAAQLALFARGGLVTFSGPMLYGDFAAETLSPFTLGWLGRVLSSPSFSLRVDEAQPAAGQWQGTLWGGNLTVLTSLAGTPYLPLVQGGILFLEDVGEDVYRVERMLQQLRLAGVLGRQSAVLMGAFSGQRQDGFDPDGYTMAHLCRSLADQTGIPFLTGLPIGHVRDIVTLPIGAQASLVVDRDGYRLSVDGYPVPARLPGALLRAAADLSLKKG